MPILMRALLAGLLLVAALFGLGAVPTNPVILITAFGSTVALDLRDSAARGLPLTPQMFGAKCDSNGTPGNGTDDFAAMQAALYAAQALGATLKIPGKTTMCRVTQRLVVSFSMTLDGDGCQPYTNNANGLLLTPRNGSWLYFDHTDKGIYQAISIPNFQIGRVIYRNFCTKRNQPPAPAIGTAWSPTDADFDIFLEQDDTLLEHLVFLNATRGMHLQGRVVVDDVRGQVYKVGFEVDNAHDTPRIHNVHWWPFGVDNKAMEQYANNNLDAFVFRAEDNAHFSDSSAVTYHRCVYLTAGGSGIANKLHASNIDCDLGQAGIVADVNGIAAQFSNFTAQGSDKLNGETVFTSTNAVAVSADNVRLGFANFRATNFGGTAVIVTGNGSAVALDGQVIIDGWGVAAPGAVAVVANGSSVITVNADPLITGGPSGAPVWGGTGTVDLLSKTKVN